MKIPPKTIYIDIFGGTSEGNSLYDWSDDRLINLMESTWYTDLHEQAKNILKQRKEKLLKMKL